MSTIQSQLQDVAEVGQPTFNEVLFWGRALNWEMIQIYAHALVALLENLKELEAEASKWNLISVRQRMDRAFLLLGSAKGFCDTLDFVSARKQTVKIKTRVAAGNCTIAEFADLVAELHTRIYEDMEEVVFFCINDTKKVAVFYERRLRETPEGHVPQLVFKRADQLFDPSIVGRWGALTEDIENAHLCFLFDQWTACAFHLMRVVEFGVLKVALLAGIEDPKPSWGAVLDKLSKYAFRTEYKDLPPGVAPHIKLIKELLPKMQAIQHAWRNDKVAHINEKLIPVRSMDEKDAKNIMNAVDGFMRTLATELPY